MGFFDKIKNSLKTKEKNNNEIKDYTIGLSKTREGFVSKLVNLTNKYSRVNEDFFNELEEILIMADIGVNTVMSFMDRLRKRVIEDKIDDPKMLKEVIVDELFIIYVSGDIIVNKINYQNEGPTIILFVGVNGVGKTTTIGKIATQEINKGKKVLMVGADTFRAGAVEQLKNWAELTGSDFVGDENLKDPASVVYNGLEKAVNESYDIVLIDTAGTIIGTVFYIIISRIILNLKSNKKFQKTIAQ